MVTGIRDYQHLNALDGAIEDAKRLRDWLLTDGEVPPENLQLVLGDGEKVGEPVVKTIQEAFDAVLDSARARGARRLYVYFAGHGLSADVTRLMLLAADARVENLGRSIDTGTYHDALGNMPLFPEQVFWYDCCRSFDRFVRGSSPTWTPADPQPPIELKQLVHYGAAFNDVANERPILGVTRGLFTTALLEALKGAAARVVNGTGVIRASDLTSYVMKRTDELAREYHLSQRPEPKICGDPDEFVVVDSVTPWLQRVEVLVEGATDEVCVYDREWNLVTRRRVDPTAQTVILDLVPDEYVVESSPQVRRRVISVRPSVRSERVSLVQT